MRLTKVLAVSVVCGLLAAGVTWAQPGPWGPRPPSVHDPSTIVKDAGQYWLFATGRSIKSYHSQDLKTWTSGPPVLTTLPAWHKRAVPRNRGHLWAPDVIHLDGRYLLYYSVSTWGVRTSAIGLATNVTLDPNAPNYEWVDQGPVIQSSDDVDFNAIDPAVTLDADGNLWMAFGSYWSGIKLIRLDRTTGKRSESDATIHALAHNEAIEAACIWRHGEHYYLFVNWGQCCRGVDSTYNIRVGRSDVITGPYLDKAGIDLLEDGGSRFLASEGRFIGPGHAGVFSENGADWLGFHYYDGQRRGLASLGIAPLTWDTQGWPTAAGPPEPVVLQGGRRGRGPAPDGP